MLSDAHLYARLTVHLLQGRLIVMRNAAPGFQARRLDWSKRMLKMLGIEVQLHAQDERLPQTALYVANHGSWVDTLAISSLIPCGFIATSGLRSWPIVGALIERTGGIFLNGVQARELEGAIGVVTHRLRSGRSTCVFPEASTSVERVIRPFGAAFFQSAIDAKLPIVPIGLRYLKDGAVTDQLRWSTHESITKSIRRVRSTTPAVVGVHVGRALDSRGRSRHDIAAEARAAVAELASLPMVQGARASPGRLDDDAREICGIVLRAVQAVAAQTVTDAAKLGEVGLDSLSGLGLVLELQRELNIPLTEELLMSLQPDVSIADLSLRFAAIKAQCRLQTSTGRSASGVVT